MTMAHPNPLQSDEWLSTQQAAELLGISGTRCRQLADAGRLETIETPLGRLYWRDSVTARLARFPHKAAGDGD